MRSWHLLVTAAFQCIVWFEVTTSWIVVAANATATTESTCSIDSGSGTTGAADTCVASPEEEEDTTTMKTTSATQQQQQDLIIDWVIENGGYFNRDKQEFRRVSTEEGSGGYYGIFATTDTIKAGDLLTSVPWVCVLEDWDEELDSHGAGFHYCGTTRLLLKEFQKGPESFYAPYTNYLKSQPRGKSPSDWSKAGKTLLEKVLGVPTASYVEQLPPFHATNLIEEYQLQCHPELTDSEQQSTSSPSGISSVISEEETLAALETLMRADDQSLIPLYDLYNHCNHPQSINLDVQVLMEEEEEDSSNQRQVVYALRDIAKGEQLCFSYNLSPHSQDIHYSTPDIFRDYGFLEALPQRWIFNFPVSPDNDFTIGFDLSQDLQLTWLEWTDWEYFVEYDNPKLISYFRRHYNRLIRIIQPHLNKLQQKISSEMSNTTTTTTISGDTTLPRPNEFDTIRQYAQAITTAIEQLLLVVTDDNDYGDDDNDYNNKEIAKRYMRLDIPTKHGPRTQEYHENFPTYNDQENPPADTQDGWTLLNYEEGVYQDVSFMTYSNSNNDNDNNSNNNHSNLCFMLNGEPQTCTAFSPHYHDIASHFPTRYLLGEQGGIRRVAIVGGGDSLLLQEILQYDSPSQRLEKVVHMELDQRNVRKCFKYFKSSPHFDDFRIEWYFGDASKTLRMLPASYFGTFDLVFVDLDESTPLSFAVSTNLTVWDSIAQLLAPNGILVKNELYLEVLNEMFDHTMLLYWEHVPMIESWALTFGTNRKDFLYPDLETMQQRQFNITTHLQNFQATPTGIDDHFKFVHDYQHNDARIQGKCTDDTATATGSSSSATDHNDDFVGGMLMVIDAEKTSFPSLGDWSKLETLLADALQGIYGLTVLSSNNTSTSDGKVLGAIVLKEGIVVARTWPKVNYLALDIHLFASINKLGDIKGSLVQVLGSDMPSSFRIITTGVIGVGDTGLTMMGPPGINHRDCKEPEPTASMKDEIDQGTIDAVTKESLGMIQEREAEGIIAVLCGGRRSMSCRALDVVSSSNDEMMIGSLKPLALWACPSIEDIETSAEMSTEQTRDLAACDEIIMEQLFESVTKYGKVAALVIDESAPLSMGMIAERILNSLVNQKELLKPKFTMLFVSSRPNNKLREWRKEFLESRRSEMIDYGHLFRAEILLGDSLVEVGILSGQDPAFFGRLINVTNTMERTTGLQTKIENVEGGVEEVDLDQEHEVFTLEDMGRPGEEQFASQTLLGEQRVLQLRLQMGSLSGNLLSISLQTWFVKQEKKGAPQAKTVTETIGTEGMVVGFMSQQATAYLVWDGKEDVIVNVFSYRPEIVNEVIEQFKLHCKSERVIFGATGDDEMPRGIGRVINLQRDLTTKVD